MNRIGRVIALASLLVFLSPARAQLPAPTRPSLGPALEDRIVLPSRPKTANRRIAVAEAFTAHISQPAAFSQTHSDQDTSSEKNL